MNQPVNRYLEAASRLNLLHLGHSAGVVYWKPAGLRLYERLRGFIRREHEEKGYQEVRSPSLVALSEFEVSGHLAKYQQNMFLAQSPAAGGEDAGGYALRPMSCPNHIELYRSERRSYRELPLAFFEFGEVFRNEPSGSLQVLFRQRQFCQDDSHVFVRASGISAQVAEYLEMSQRVYQALGFSDVEFAISLRPAERFGEDALWDAAEEALRVACRAAGVSWQEQPGGGAFYGPKIELGVRDKLGRLWQMGTLQLDYVLPRRFELSFQNEEGAYEEPVLLHHAVLGSLERMIGILLEVHGEKLPDFLHPYPLVVVPVSQKSLEYGRALSAHLKRSEPVVLLDEGDEPLGAKLRRWKQRGVCRLLVVGEKEAQGWLNGGLFEASDSAGAHPVPVRL